MKVIMFMLFLSSCSNSVVFKKGDCFVEPKDGGYYKVLEVYPKAYISQAFGKYMKPGLPHIPRIMTITGDYTPIECFQGDFEKVYMKHTNRLFQEFSK